MANSRPLVTAACLCEKVLQERDGVSSLIRIVDTFDVDVPDPRPAGPVGIAFTIFLSLKSGDVTGKHEIALKLEGPAGPIGHDQTWPVVFTGGEQGVAVTVEFGMLGPEPGKLPEAGLYGFDVLWEGEVLTRIPFRVRHKQRTTGPELRP